jgi:hypothetical protein
MFYFEQKLKRVENDMRKPRHHFHGRNTGDDDKDFNDNVIEENIAEEDKNLEKKDLINDQIIEENSNDAEQSCNIDSEFIPKPDIQMLNAYREIPFENLDGGVWKQGNYFIN